MNTIINAKSLHDLEASLAVIASNINAYYNGNMHTYRPVAVELRKLLCDTQRKTNNSLAKKFFPDLRLHPLSVNQNITKDTILYIPGHLSFDGRGGSNLTQLFNESAPSLPLHDWLQQKLFDYTMTINSFIRSVADKEGAHSDKSYNTILRKTKSILVTNNVIVATTILSTACFVVKTLALRMINDNISEIGTKLIGEYKRVGRGFAVLNLTEFACSSLRNISMEYAPTSSARAYFHQNIKKFKAAMHLLQTYQPSKCFVLFISGFNDESWLYKHDLE